MKISQIMIIGLEILFTNADIFISMNEGFQANATLESLIDNTI
ncbi:MAG: hypothetical protein Ct9H90mP3_7880 [Flammeovirgaceae bacterium]|nr:MAG: hypothetical protein Ct9H90mP3_7880 [Flammeovirgaceae bacterium]